MQILRRCECNTSAISRVFRFSLYSTETLTSTPPEDSLQSRISSAIDSQVTLVPALEQWRKEGRSIKQHDLHRLIRKLRTFKRYHHALEVSTLSLLFSPVSASFLDCFFFFAYFCFSPLKFGVSMKISDLEC